MARPWRQNSENLEMTKTGRQDRRLRPEGRRPSDEDGDDGARRVPDTTGGYRTWLRDDDDKNYEDRLRRIPMTKKPEDWVRVKTHDKTRNAHKHPARTQW